MRLMDSMRRQDDLAPRAGWPGRRPPPPAGPTRRPGLSSARARRRADRRAAHCRAGLGRSRLRPWPITPRRPPRPAPGTGERRPGGTPEFGGCTERIEPRSGRRASARPSTPLAGSRDRPMIADVPEAVVNPDSWMNRAPSWIPKRTARYTILRAELTVTYGNSRLASRLLYDKAVICVLSRHIRSGVRGTGGRVVREASVVPGIPGGKG